MRSYSAFSSIRTEYGEVENAEQNNSEYGHFLRSDATDLQVCPQCLIFMSFINSKAAVQRCHMKKVF